MIARVLLAAYMLAVSLLYALLSVTSPDAADAALIGFVAVLLVPAGVHEHRRRR